MKRATQIRCTSKTRLRAANMKRLIDELRIRLLSSMDIQIFLEFSGSGVRRYIEDLKARLIIEVAWSKPTKTGIVLSPKYRLCTDPDLEMRIEQYFSKLAQPEAISAEEREQQRIHRKKEKLEADPTRHFHLMSDDMPFQVKFNKAPVKRDEFQALFFGEKGTAKP